MRKTMVWGLSMLGMAMFTAMPLWAEPETPWGRASLDAIDYAPQKVVYDVAEGDPERFDRILDRVSFLNNLYGADPFDASIVLVLHGGEIEFFAVENYEKYGELMRRAQSLTIAGPVEFRMCQAAAQARGYDAEDIHGFVRVVPMADAEIIRLQQEEGHVFMQ